jgi:hypothetical protein
VFVTMPECEMGSCHNNPLLCQLIDPDPSIVADSPLPPSMNSRTDSSTACALVRRQTDAAICGRDRQRNWRHVSASSFPGILHHHNVAQNVGVMVLPSSPRIGSHRYVTKQFLILVICCIEINHLQCLGKLQ